MNYKAEICKIGKMMEEKGYVDYFEGNISILDRENNKLYITGYMYSNNDYPFQKANLIVNGSDGRDIKNPTFKGNMSSGASEAARSEMEDLNYGNMSNKNQGVFAIEVPRTERGKWDLTEGGTFTIEIKFTFAKNLKQADDQIIVNKTIRVTVVMDAEGGGEVFTRPEDQLSYFGYE